MENSRVVFHASWFSPEKAGPLYMFPPGKDVCSWEIFMSSSLFFALPYVEGQFPFQIAMKHHLLQDGTSWNLFWHPSSSPFQILEKVLEMQLSPESLTCSWNWSERPWEWTHLTSLQTFVTWHGQRFLKNVSVSLICLVTQSKLER